MRHPHKFPMALSGVMFFLLGNFIFLLHLIVLMSNFSFFVVLFGGAGVLAYLTFGSDIQTVVLVNLDTSSKTVQSVRCSGYVSPRLLPGQFDRYNFSIHLRFFCQYLSNSSLSSVFSRTDFL